MVLVLRDFWATFFVVLFSHTGLCLSFNLDLPNAQNVLSSHSEVSLLKWKECGELNNHTLECNYAGASGETVRKADRSQALDLMFQWITSIKHPIRRFLSRSSAFWALMFPPRTGIQSCSTQVGLEVYVISKCTNFANGEQEAGLTSFTEQVVRSTPSLARISTCSASIRVG